LPGVSETLTGRSRCLIYNGKGEGPEAQRLREFLRRSIRQRTVRPLLVVIMSPTLDLLARIGDIEKHFGVQAFIA
jgi:hypothetical protein